MTEPSDRPALPPAPRPAKKRLLLFAPLLILLGFIAVAALRIHAAEKSGPDDDLPNILIGRAAPHLHLPFLPAFAGGANAAAAFDSNDFRGQITLVNFWGSWCPPCRAEHPFLLELAHNRQYSGHFRLVGVNYKDSADNAARFLNGFGNPFAEIGYDSQGRAAIDWGVYGPPETFVLSKSGLILYRFIGPMDAQSFRAKIWPIIQRAQARS